jgi:hypothetical protein
MVLVFKVAGSLTRGWRLGRAPALAPANAAGVAPAYQERALNLASQSSVAAAAVASDRVRSTVASLESMTSSHRLSAPAVARLAPPPPASVPALPGPNDARSQMRYLHHRVAGVSNPSREMLR